MSDWLALQGLDATDLEANRKGAITERQRARVLGFASRQRRLTALILVASGAISGGLLFAVSFSALAVVIPLVFMVVIYGLLELLMFGPWTRAADHPNLVRTEGTIDFVYASPSRRALYLTLAGVGFNGLGLYELGPVLTKGTRVRLYTLQPRGLIVAVEPLDPAP